MAPRDMNNPAGDWRVVVSRVSFPPTALPDFSRLVGVRGFGSNSPAPAYVSIYGQHAVSARNGPWSAAESLSALASGSRPGAGGAVRVRVQWGDGALGQSVDVDAVSGRVLVLPVTRSVDISILMPSDPVFGGLVTDGEGLLPQAPGESQNIVTSSVGVSVSYGQQYSFPDTQTLTDVFSLGPGGGGEPPQPPTQLFVPVPRFGRRVRWSYGPDNPGELPQVNAQWALWAQSGSPSGAVLGAPVQVDVGQTVVGAMQGIVFTGDPDFVSRVHCVWELEL